MKAFRFRLEKVRRIRETQRRQSQAQFMETQRLLAAQIRQLAKVQRERQRAECMYSASAHGETRAGNILGARYYLAATEGRVAAQKENVATAEQKVEESRVDLIEKTKDKKILDRLRERCLAEHTINAQREKQKQIDETARQNYFRRQRTKE